MDLAANALFSLDEVRRFVPMAGSKLDDLLIDAVNEASDIIESGYDGVLVTPSTKVNGTWANYFTEYHPAPGKSLGGSDILPNEFPLVAVVAIYEAGTLLVVNTDYQVITKPVGLIRRISGGLPVAWPQSTVSTTYRQVELRYVAGYRRHDDTDIASVPMVPERIRRVGRELVTWIVRQRSNQEVGLSSTSDAAGNRTFSGPAYLTDAMKLQLGGTGRHFARRYATGERA